MNRRATWILILLFGLAAALTWYLSRTSAQESGAATATPVPGTQRLFADADGTVTLLRVEDQAGAVVEIRRGASGVWTTTAPLIGPADASAAEAAATQVKSLRILAEPEVPAADVGLEQPAYRITVNFSGGRSEQLEVGSRTATNSGYYVRRSDGRILVLSRAGIEPLLNLLTQPPYSQPTSTP